MLGIVKWPAGEEHVLVQGASAFQEGTPSSHENASSFPPSLVASQKY